MIFPNIWENKIDVPNHQPVFVIYSIQRNSRTSQIPTSPSRQPRRGPTPAPGPPCTISRSRWELRSRIHSQSLWWPQHWPLQGTQRIWLENMIDVSWKILIMINHGHGQLFQLTHLSWEMGFDVPAFFETWRKNIEFCWLESIDCWFLPSQNHMPLSSQPINSWIFPRGPSQIRIRCNKYLKPPTVACHDFIRQQLNNNHQKGDHDSSPQVTTPGAVKCPTIKTRVAN